VGVTLLHMPCYTSLMVASAMFTGELQDKGRGSIVMLRVCLGNRSANMALHRWQHAGSNLKAS